METVMILFVDGAVMMGMAVAGLLFLRFWKRTDDRLFVIFAVAFFALALNRFFLALLAHSPTTVPFEHHTILYIVRLVAFVLILAAIADKNRRAKAQSRVADRSLEK
jgi:hypothetical protein